MNRLGNALVGRSSTAMMSMGLFTLLACGGDRVPDAALQEETVPPPQMAEEVARQDSQQMGQPGPQQVGERADQRAARQDPDSTNSSDPTLAAKPAASSESPPAAGPPVFAWPDTTRGIYLNAWAAGSSNRSEALLELARRTEVNTFVVDVKDASGYVSYPTQVALAEEVGADEEIRIRDIRGLLARMEEAGVFPVARIVVFKDPLLAAARPDLAVQDSAGGPWVDGNGHVWVNPWAEEVWEYHVDLAREAVELGFREIQWDYIRFPDRPVSEMARAVFPGGEGRERVEAVVGFLSRAQEALADLGVPLSGDLFGVVTSFRKDVGIGQVWEPLVPHLDGVLPMVYPSHYWEGSFGLQHPNANPYEVVRAALADAVQRSGDMEPGLRPHRIIPWLQDFTLGDPPYGVAEVRAQMQAGSDVGVPHWVLWNASSRYTEGALRPVSGWAGGVAPAIRRAAEVGCPEAC